MIEERIDNKDHGCRVERLKKILANNDLPSLPLTCVKSGFYTTDIITRIDTKFIPIEFANSKHQFVWDMGRLTLIYNKDIIDFCLCVVADKLWNANLHDFRKAKLNLPPRIVMIPEGEFADYVETLI